MIKVAERISEDGKRRAAIWHDGDTFSVMLYEDEKLVHTFKKGGVVRESEILAEDYVAGKSNPQLLCEG